MRMLMNYYRAQSEFWSSNIRQCHNPCIQLIYPMTPGHPHGQDKPVVEVEELEEFPKHKFQFLVK